MVRYLTILFYLLLIYLLHRNLIGLLYIIHSQFLNLFVPNLLFLYICLKSLLPLRSYLFVFKPLIVKILCNSKEMCTFPSLSVLLRTTCIRFSETVNRFHREFHSNRNYHSVSASLISIGNFGKIGICKVLLGLFCRK